MEPVVRAGSQSVPLPENSKPHTSLVESMAYQCLSPITAELPEDVIRRTRDIESEQRRLIAQLEQSDDNKSKSARGNSSYDWPMTVNSAPAHISPSQRNPLTPPLSTTSTPHKSNHFPPPDSPNQTTSENSGGSGVSRRSRSFGGRRSRKPRELDLDALRRERQFSGPYSANPLLPRKRQTQSADDRSGKDGDEIPKRQRPSLELEPLEPEPNSSSRNIIRLPILSQMTTAPFVANGGGRTPEMLWPPLCSPSPRSAASSLPASAQQLTTLFPRPNKSVQASPSSTRNEPHTISQESGSQLEEGKSSESDQPKEGQSESSGQAKDKGGDLSSEGSTQTKNNTQPNSQINSTNSVNATEKERKARYMQLCSETWDLLHNQITRTNSS